MWTESCRIPFRALWGIGGNMSATRLVVREKAPNQKWARLPIGLYGGTGSLPPGRCVATGSALACEGT